jgi:putative CocE/NonD family hydrolase
VEWAAQQPWSNGKVALVGSSCSAITQFRVAAKRPQGLVAMAPVNPMTDLYRDVAYPGGIPNSAIGPFFSATQNSFQLLPFAHSENLDPPEDAERCARHLAQRPGALENQLALTLPQHPHLDEFHTARSSIDHVDEIDVPLFTSISWQDNILGSRTAEFLARLHVDYRAIFSNGGHESSRAVTRELIRFLAHHVKGAEPEYADIPRVRVWWERTTNLDTDDGVPTWETTFAAWPPPQVKARTLALTEGGINLDGSPGTGQPDSYAYVPGSGQVPLIGAWNAAPMPGASLSYTTPPLPSDLVVAGPGSVDLSMTSTAANTDVQVVVTEVRQGTETYVQSGWLRASHRALDPSSSDLQPIHPHDEKTVKATPDMSATTPEKLRVELPAFAHTFRAGSQIRVWIEAPHATPGVYGFASWPVPAHNTVHHDGPAQSALVLAEVPGAKAEAPAPACGALRAQPCRISLR